MDHLKDLDLFRYKLPLTRSLTLGDRTIELRKGLLVQVRDTKGRVGWGDVAPLPGFSSETVEAAANQIISSSALLLDSLSVEGVTKAVRSREAAPLDALKPVDLFPSVRFGLEQAALMLQAQRTGRSVPTLLGNEAVTRLPLNCVLAGDSPTDIAAAARDLANQGYRSIKLKVGRRSISTDIATAQAVNEAVAGRDIALRLDANRAWELDQARKFCERIEDCSIEYIEEPLSDPTHLPELSDHSPHPLALDETTREITPETLEAHKFASAIVLKPSLMGGFAASARWIEAARPLNITPVVSSSFESGIGLLGLTWFAVGGGLGTIPAGLDTWRWLAQDIVVPPLTADAAHLPIRPPDEIVINQSRLTPVA